MPRSNKPLEHQARRRLRRVTPDNAGKVVSSDIYWTVPFLELYLEKCDAVAFEAPAEAYKLAFHAPSLADLIGVGNRAGEYATEREKLSHQIRARCVLGSACFRIGKNDDATRAYAQAQDLLSCGEVLPLT